MRVRIACRILVCKLRYYTVSIKYFKTCQNEPFRSCDKFPDNYSIFCRLKIFNKYSYASNGKNLNTFAKIEVLTVSFKWILQHSQQRRVCKLTMINCVCRIDVYCWRCRDNPQFKRDCQFNSTLHHRLIAHLPWAWMGLMVNVEVLTWYHLPRYLYQIHLPGFSCKFLLLYQ